MSNYCVDCGAHLAGGSFCPECGHPVAESPTEARAQREPPPPQATPRAPTWRQHPLVVFGAIAALVTIGLLGTFAVRAQVQLNADQEAAQIAQDKARADAEARAQRAKLRQAKAKARAKARRQAEKESPTVVVVPAPEQAYDGPVDGTWTGSMNNGAYTYWMTLYEYGGQLEGEMYQEEASTGRSGTEILEGYRDGNVLYLHGVWWRNAPKSWSLDDMTLTLSSGGRSFTGTYTCGSCSGSHPISGSRA